VTWTPVTATPPKWFTDAVSAPVEDRTVEVDGVPIHYLDWGTKGLPGLVLVHGGAAHAEWWSFLGPFFTSRWHVIALDLSGHGNSGRRPAYTHATWSDEVMAVCEEAGFAEPPIVVGHSLGGGVTVMTSVRFGDRLAGAVIVDSPVRRRDPESEEARKGRAFRFPRVYADLPSALERFRLIPAQPCDNDYIIDHIARRSLRQTERGWEWKFDPLALQHDLAPVSEHIRSIRSRVAVLRGEHSVVVPPDTADYLHELLGRNAPVVSIPDSHHHLIIDQPLAFVASLRTLLADWEHSTPHRR
jgi:pimeloyl-ACP methyl ester carboxylesterase